MKKLEIFAILFFILIILTNSIEIMNSIRISFNICFNNLFPSLIPFMLLSNILLEFNFVNDLSIILGKFMNKIFKVNKNTSFAFIMSILSGTPSNAKYLNDLLKNGLISTRDVQKCLNFCHFTNPIFILGTVGFIYLHDKKLGIIVLISHYLSSIIIGLFNKKDKIDINGCIKKNENKKNFIKIINESICSTANTLLLILGIITCFLSFTCLINKIFNIPDNYKFLYGLIELTQGLSFLGNSNLSIITKTIVSSFLVSFGGVSIHAQVFSILDNKKIRYLPYFLSRIFSGIIASIISFTILNLLY